MASSGVAKTQNRRFNDNHPGVVAISSMSIVKSENLDDPVEINQRHDLNAFYCSTRLMLYIGGMLGMFPLSGLSEANSRQLRFAPSSPFAVLYFATLAGQGFMFIMAMHFLLRDSISLTNCLTCSNYIVSFFTLIIMAKIGRNWPKLTEKVEEIERNLPPFRRNIPFYCNVAVACFLLTSIVEEILNIVYNYSVANACEDVDIERYCYIDKPWIFDYLPYSLWEGILVQIFVMQSDLMWGYTDLLLMVISIYLAEHFVVHNQILKEASMEEDVSYEKLLSQYSQIFSLVNMLSKEFGACVLISFGNNLYWTTTQLFYSLNIDESGIYVSCNADNAGGQSQEYEANYKAERALYFIYSFVLLVVHLFLVLLLASRIHSKSMEPLRVVYEIPPHKFHSQAQIQVKRYIAQIKNVKVALSGLGFFYVTRAMTLTLLNTIVTYELVLLQYHKK